MNRFALFLSLALATAFAPSRAAAAVVTAYDLSVNNSVTTTITKTTASGVTASDLGRVGVSAFDNFGAFGAFGWPTSGLSLTKYFSLTITPDDGATMSLNRLSFAEKRRATQGPMAFQVRSSLDGFLTPLIADTNTVYDSTSFSTTRHHTYTLGAEFADLTQPVTFRLYAYQSQVAATNELGLWQISNYDGSAGGASGGVVVEGSITLAAVPEASAALLSIAAASLATFVASFRRGR